MEENCSVCSRRKFYQEGYQDGLKDGMADGLKYANELLCEIIKDHQDKIDNYLKGED